MTRSGSTGNKGTRTRRARFNSWRSGRPFAGGALLVVASLVIAWIPINIAPDTILIGETLSPIGLLFAALVFLCGIFALTRPGNADLFGIFGVVFSIFSLYGALGGLGIGLVLGIIGGVLCYAWRDEDEDEGEGGSGGETTDGDFDFAGEDDSEGDDSGGLFGTRSRAQRAVSADGAGAGGRTPSIALLLVSVVVLSAFAHPLMAAAARDFPEQEGIDGTVVVAEEFSGSGFNHENVTTDSSNRESVPAGQFSFKSDVNIEGMTMYKNFRGGPGGASHLTITGSSASAPDGLSMTASEAYFGRLGIGTDPVVVPAARKKWSTCPGQDFLFSNGDLGPLPGPPIDASKVVTNTHQLSASTITIENLELTMQGGTKSTSVSGTPECTKDPVEPALDLFTANALALLTDEGVLSPNVTTNNGTVTNLSAPAEVERNESYDVSATVTNAGYIEDDTTVEYRRAGETLAQQNVTLGPEESTTVTFADLGTEGLEAGEYDHSVVAGENAASGTITVVEANESANTTDASTNVTTDSANETDATNTTADVTTETTSTSEGTTVETATTATPEETTATTAPTQTPSANSTSRTTTTAPSTPTATPSPTPAAETTASETDRSATATTSTETATTTAQQTAATNGSSLVGAPK